MLGTWVPVAASLAAFAIVFVAMGWALICDIRDTRAYERSLADDRKYWARKAQH